MREASFRQDQLIVLFGVATVGPAPGSMGSTEFATNPVTRGDPSPRHLESRSERARLHF